MRLYNITYTANCCGKRVECLTDDPVKSSFEAVRLFGGISNLSVTPAFGFIGRNIFKNAAL